MTPQGNHEGCEEEDGPWTPERITALLVWMRLEGKQQNTVLFRGKYRPRRTYWIVRSTGSMSDGVQTYDIEDFCAMLNACDAVLEQPNY